ncbi:WxL domain-containing protein [Enterococcus sp. RIT-PI-f]|uniref:WxL domain-containing protein n=1 Tax=Enterococcus sp. RIT-PI-f TaxID=1690244 RepID=UPI0006CCB17C|nr:WxL domain-containing protein [Enterococcus sp. RIT-PI-f]KPG71767.1 hypothetical protein AEQ18_03505 [Enterococcus sp. RIT-PI-f]
MKSHQIATAATITALALGSTQTIFAEETTETELKSVQTQGTITFESPDGPSIIVPPVEEPDIIPEEPDETAGPLAIVHAPNLDFGTQEISVQDETYTMLAEKAKTKDGKEVPYVSFVQVQDLRGSNAGWSLMVSLSDFTSDNTQNNILKGAALTFTPGVLNYSGDDISKPGFVETLEIGAKSSNTVVIDAQTKVVEDKTVGEGAGVTSLVWGDQEKLNKAEPDEQVLNDAITLFVPKTATKDAAEYTATLTWELTSTPANVID